MIIGAVTFDQQAIEALATQAAAADCEFVSFDSLLAALEASPAIVFAEWPIDKSAADIIEGLLRSRTREPNVPVVVLVQRGLPTLQRRALEAGASDVLLMPLVAAEIAAEIESTFGEPILLSPEKRNVFEKLLETSLVGRSTTFQRCLLSVIRAAVSETNVLLLGETGTGKDVVASAIHQLSSRHGELHAVNIAAFPRELIESRLFGHVKGSFTGAEKDTDGVFAAAGIGTLFLDEIGDLDYPLQSKLLRVVENRHFQRVGENRFLEFRARLITATWRDLDVAVVQNRFRKDLLVRLDQFRIVLPALRDRREDIPLLVERFLKKYGLGQGYTVSHSAAVRLYEYDYPGNVRELENAISSAIGSARPSTLILPKHLPADVQRGAGNRQGGDDLILRMPKAATYEETRAAALEVVDGIFLNEYLRSQNGNQSAAADMAGVDRKTFSIRWKNAQKWIKP